MGASVAFRRGRPAAGGAAAFGSPERRLWRADAAATCGHAGIDSGDSAAPRHAIVREEGEAATVDLAPRVDLDGEQRSVEDAWRRRQPAAACGREKG